MIELLTDPRRKYGPSEHLHRVVPNFTRADLAKDFARRGFTTGVEVGVADGRYSLTLCQSIPNLKLFCVDPWAPYQGNPRGGPASQHERNYALAKQRLEPFGATLIRKHSVEAVLEFAPESLDFCFLDGNHGLPWVVSDLVQWGMRVKHGGIVAGHDFYHFKGAGVVEAVVAYTETHGIKDWHLCDEREPSFWWVKQ